MLMKNYVGSIIKEIHQGNFDWPYEKILSEIGRTSGVVQKLAAKAMLAAQEQYLALHK